MILTYAIVRTQVAAIARAVEDGDFEMAHAKEDYLYKLLLEQIRNECLCGCATLAYEALKTQNVKFKRVYS